ncbi:hypothetical protein F7725_027391 [Dissostichus mawsoni]|uniref:Uncharacterized protein n=1 Tax=Dissostichus mawsoni TaxID=36200 RepID=A0A7J5XDA5_DISMA|nr:hypothetical protein F7725_027391 [Dissostichus mawsoni]
MTDHNTKSVGGSDMPIYSLRIIRTGIEYRVGAFHNLLDNHFGQAFCAVAVVRNFHIQDISKKLTSEIRAKEPKNVRSAPPQNEACLLVARERQNHEKNHSGFKSVGKLFLKVFTLKSMSKFHCSLICFILGSVTVCPLGTLAFVVCVYYATPNVFIICFKENMFFKVICYLQTTRWQQSS